MQIVRIRSELPWTVMEGSGGKGYVAVSDAVGLTMSGHDLDELAANIRETLQLMMVDLLESGELDAFLRSHGWVKEGELDPHHPQFDVPFTLKLNGRQARAVRQ